ncbi:MAG: hypothetical protein JJU29_08415 [Verrucomicrobia bacterium]|nr:hypothetical protein [Verrucomicrobiota bacterium]MCH8512125.1 hypothetical protein [Kiritimatiellia bacterium]
MIQIDTRSHGYTALLKEEIDLPAVQELDFDLRNELAGLEDSEFVLVLDARKFHHFTADGQALFEELLEFCFESGLARISVLAVSTAHAGLFCEMMLRADLMDIYQYLDLSYEEDWRTELETFLAEPFD